MAASAGTQGRRLPIAIIGKWHVGHADRKFWPQQRGFDYKYGPLIGEIDYFTHKVDGKVDWYRNGEVVEEEGYSTTLLGNDAVKLIGGIQDPSRRFYAASATAM